MREDRKTLIEEHYTLLLDLREKLSGVIDQAGLRLTLPDAPPRPATMDELAGCVAQIRSSILLVERALHELDRQINGCEVRTRQQVEQDAEHDRLALLGYTQTTDSRSRQEIEGNLAYDRMQLQRM